MNIGNLKLHHGIFLAPMAGVTDIAYRGLCKAMGADLVYTEMISAKGILYNNKNTIELLRLSQEEKQVAVQIFGRDPLVMAKAAEIFNDKEDIALIDINMGCPAPKIVKNGEGSALMNEPILAKKIVSEVKRASQKPVTVKIRKGFSKEENNAVDFSKYLEQGGVDAIAVHGRTKAQMYEGRADWNVIKEVKANIGVPVIGNGDIFTYRDALNMKEFTKCDGIMIGRGAMGNPWIFKSIAELLSDKDLTVVTNKDKVEMCIRHYELALKYYGEYKAVREMRKQVGWYIKAMENSGDLRNVINREEKSEKVIAILKEFYKQQC